MPYEPGSDWQYDVPTTGSTHLPPDADYGKALTNQGYGFEVAVADLIDNSIDAGADKVVVHFLRDADRILSLLIVDNGKGMDDAGLGAAMTVGRRRDYGVGASEPRVTPDGSIDPRDVSMAFPFVAPLSTPIGDRPLVRFRAIDSTRADAAITDRDHIRA